MEAPTYPYTIVAPHNKMRGILNARHLAAHPALSTDHVEGTPYLAVHKREALDAYEYIQTQLHAPGGKW
uniref:Uncharacterized protein n=1 Tax=Mycena chlorophos TaxID=658473 RepID=A0ABQ0LB86_MYCCL|nr:predicted protein [Mycena chlorophos]